jgi:Flp pilus assembly protein TadD
MRRALEIYPDYAQIHYNLAVLLVKRGARDEAVTHLERAIALAPGNPRPRALLDQLTR